jgi:DNA-binding CsgD family transcriptional regulator
MSRELVPLQLEPHELRILQLSVMGYSIKEIGEIMSKSEHTVRHYRKQMLQKNNCNFNVLIYRYVQMRSSDRGVIS